MQIAQLSMKPLADDLAVTHDDRSNKRIRTDFLPPALRKLKSSSQMRLIRACELGIHWTD